MATELPSNLSDAQLLYQYIGRRLDNGGRDMPADALLAELNQYQLQLEKLRDMIRTAEHSLARGEGGPLDIDELLDEMTAELAKEGITD